MRASDQDWRGYPQVELGGWLHEVDDKVLMDLGQISKHARIKLVGEKMASTESRIPLNVPNSFSRLW
jgi:hypothetical protein